MQLFHCQVTNAILCHRPVVIALCVMKVTGSQRNCILQFVFDICIYLFCLYCSCRRFFLESKEWPCGVEVYVRERFGDAEGLQIIKEIKTICQHFMATPHVVSSANSQLLMDCMKKLKSVQNWTRKQTIAPLS